MSYERDVAKFSKSLTEALKRARSSKEMEFLAGAAINIIQTRTWKGKGVDRPGGNTFNLKKLSKSYIEQRKRNRGRLSAKTTPTTSNLTYTGQMLYSLGFKKGSKNIVIGPQGNRRDGGTNAKVAEYVSKVRPFMFLAADEQVQLNKFFVKRFDEIVSTTVR